MRETPVFHIGIIRRGEGSCRSAVDAAAYLFGEKWTSAYDGQTYDHSTKAGEVVYRAILAPEDSPSFVYQPFTLSHAIEWSERQKNAQLLRHIYFSVPPELTREQQIALITDYVQEAFLSRGMIALVALHDGERGNPNAHVLLLLRPLLPDGSFAPKALQEYVLDEQGQRVKDESRQYKRKKISTTDWNYQSNGELWRSLWAEVTNKHLQLAGLDLQIDLVNGVKSAQILRRN